MYIINSSCGVLIHASRIPRPALQYPVERVERLLIVLDDLPRISFGDTQAIERLRRKDIAESIMLHRIAEWGLE